MNLQTCPTEWIHPLSNFRGGISVVTESGQETKSHLVIQNARETDEGNYTCKPSIFKSASVKLYVLDGKNWRKKVFLELIEEALSESLAS